MFKPFSDEQLYEMEQRFGVIHLYTPAPRPRSKWAPALPKDAPPPEPAYQLVFRPCTPAEWREIQGQANDPKRAPGAPLNLCRMCVVAVSHDGKQTVHAGAAGTPPNDTAASKGPRDAFAALIEIPGNVAIPDAVMDDLMALNGKIANDSEKG